jgi:hypothetical protein
VLNPYPVEELSVAAAALALLDRKPVTATRREQACGTTAGCRLR